MPSNSVKIDHDNNNVEIDNSSKKIIVDFSELLELLYASSLSPTGFQPFLDKMVSQFELADIIMYFAKTATSEVYSAWMSGPKVPALLEHVDKNLGSVDYVLDYIQSSPMSRFYSLQTDIGRTPLAQRHGAISEAEKWFDSHNFSDACGALIHRDADSIACILAHRQTRHGTFSQHDVLILDNLMPHIKQAYLLYKKHTESENNNNWENALELLPQASLIFGSRGELIHHNTQARKQIARLDGIHLSDDRMTFDNPEHSRQFTINLLRAVTMNYTEHHGFQIMTLHDQSGADNGVLVFTPVLANLSTQGAMVFLIEKNQPVQLNPALLNQLYQLNEMEIKVCEYTVRGYTRQEMARQLNRSPHTIKDYLKSIYSKTGTRKQAELIVMIITTSNLTSPPNWG
ncbi:helix-turn-helix transcriptional regulator [Vibrio sp. E150_011]